MTKLISIYDIHKKYAFRAIDYAVKMYTDPSMRSLRFEYTSRTSSFNDDVFGVSYIKARDMSLVESHKYKSNTPKHDNKKQKKQT